MSDQPQLPTGHDAGWAPYPLKPPLEVEQCKTTSFYLSMRDGVKIAVSLHLPADLGLDAKLPAILHATRYWRKPTLLGLMPYTDIRRYLANGYAWVDVDARGSGASFGYQPGPWQRAEAEDYGEIITWIAQQPWSNGSVGAVGISNDGTTTDMAATAMNLALKAAMPEFSLFDSLPDIARPGGILLSDFLLGWATMNDQLDRNEPRELTLPDGRKLMLTVLPTDEDTDGSLLQAAVDTHKHNYNALQAVARSQFRDDPLESDPTLRLEDFSPHGFYRNVQKAGTPVYSMSAWYDGAYPLASIHRFLNIRTPGSKLILGPWSHGGGYNCTPGMECLAGFDRVAEEMRYFDHHLKGIDTGIQDEPAVHYYTMVEDKWKSADTFPPPCEPTPMYLQAGGRLGKEAPSATGGQDEYQVDYSCTTETKGRWNTLLGGRMVQYPERLEEDKKLLCHTSAPLEADLEVTGMPTAELFVSSSTSDANIFVYLEDVWEDGSVHLVTEGQLRAFHRKLSEKKPPYTHAVPYHTFERRDAVPLEPGEVAELVFHLLPVSYLFKAGHCLRVAIAGADAAHFEIPRCPPPLLKMFREKLAASRLILPVIPRG